MSGQDDKAAHYIHSLDAARCSGSWKELPELIRKVTKHAPERKCLIQTATTDNDVARTVSLRSAGPSSISERIPQLISSIGIEKTSAEERFQAQTCLAWSYWILGQPEKPAERLSQEISAAVTQFTARDQSCSAWTEVCLLKSTYIRGAALLQTGDSTNALLAFQSIVPWIKKSQEKILAHPQLAYWSEQLLAQSVLLYVQELDSHLYLLEAPLVSQALQTFQDWAPLAMKSREVPPETFGNSSAHLGRLPIWKAYYGFLSRMLQLHSSAEGDNQKFEQATTLRRVETMYENELLRVTPFPKATESNTVVEDWVEEVIENWQILCSKPYWEGILEESGRNSDDRKVLDILYRAAARTFHSTLILRRLFQVHRSLAEFELAYKALDTYLELIERGRTRAAKSNEAPTGQDSDETVLRTISEGIESLCSFGSQDEAEKANHLSEKLEEWIERLSVESRKFLSTNGQTEDDVDDRSGQKASVSPETLEIVYRAIGIARAHWARWTPVNENRASLQSQAVLNLKKSIAQLPESRNHIPSIYALGMILAEMRDINQAIETVKEALVAKSSSSVPTSNFSAERDLIPLWHLLALLLTARQDFETAGQTCVAAFEQFTSSNILFGARKQIILSSTTSKERSSFMDDSGRGLVDEMECGELQRIIEVRITELALTELVEGPEEAVNRSDELLGLYSRLFGRFGVTAEDKPALKNSEPPKSSATTVRSFRGSVFGRRKIENLEGFNKTDSLHKAPSTRPTTQATEAPTIQVTDEHGRSPTHKHHIFHKSEDHHTRSNKHSSKGHQREGSISKYIRSRSKDRKPEPNKSMESSHNESFDTTREHVHANGTTEVTDPEKNQENAAPQTTTDDVPVPSTSLTSHSSPQAKQGLSSKQDNSESDNFQPTHASSIDKQPSQRKSSPIQLLNTPTPRFPKTATQKHAFALLLKIWLVIATLYRRAHLFDDAREACDEAAKVAQKIETLTGNVESSARNFALAGWGGIGKSSDELWADVYCERAQLALETACPSGEKGVKGAADSERVRDAVDHLEQCLMYYPDHAKGIVALSNVLLDFYEKKVELGRRVDDGKPKEDQPERVKPSAIKVSNNTPNGIPAIALMENRPSSGMNQSSSGAMSISGQGQADDELKKTPENLNRLAARDRAYGLLSTLTKLGTSWDNSEAWFALARAHELGGEVEKERDVLWWCVDLEDKRPLRHWSNISCTGYVL